MLVGFWWMCGGNAVERFNDVLFPILHRPICIMLKYIVFTIALTRCLFVDGELSAHLAGLHNLK